MSFSTSCAFYGHISQQELTYVAEISATVHVTFLSLYMIIGHENKPERPLSFMVTCT